MAKITFKGQSEYYAKLKLLEDLYCKKDGTIKAAVYEGAKVVADAIRSRIRSIPVAGFQRLPKGKKYSGNTQNRDGLAKLSKQENVYAKKFSGISKEQQEDLLYSFGLSKINRENGYVNTKAGFDGYGSFPTGTYPKGVPNALLARAVESGSSVREKHPFVAPAVRESRHQAIREMEDVIDEQMKNIFESGYEIACQVWDIFEGG